MLLLIPILQLHKVNNYNTLLRKQKVLQKIWPDSAREPMEDGTGKEEIFFCVFSKKTVNKAN